MMRRRWVVALTTLAICVTLVSAVARPVPASPQTAHTLSLLAIALSAYGWVVSPSVGSAVVSLVVLLCLAWAWAAGETSILGWDMLGLLMVWGAAAFQQRRRARRFLRMEQTVDDLEEERTVKGQAITVADQAREGLQKKFSRYAQLQSIAEELSNMTDLAAVAQLVVDRAFSLIGKSDVCLLFMVDKERQELSLFASKKRESIVSIRAKHGDQFDRYVLRSHRPLLVNDVRRDFRFTVSAVPERPVASVIACPLILGQSPEGVLRLDSAQPGAYTQDDLRFLDILLDLASAAVTNARLFAQTQQLAITDGLTGLTLRRPFLEQLTRELVRAGRSREPASVVMLDVDHFKAYNDAFGHSAGDLILKSVAGVLREVVPPGGVIARYGGEEFAVLLPRMARPQAAEIAERIRRMVEQHVHGSGRRPRSAEASEKPGASVLETERGTASRSVVSMPQGGVTVSLGVAAFPDDAKAELELIRVADERLYAAKRAGRNLVISA